MKVNFSFMIGALKFKNEFQNAKEFNLAVKQGGLLIFAPLYEETKIDLITNEVRSRSISFNSVDGKIEINEKKN